MFRYFLFLFKITLFFILIFCSGFCYAQPLTKAASNAFVITRMVEKFHVQPRILNDSLSADFYKTFLRQLDDERIYFNKKDIEQLSVYRFQLDDEVKENKADFLNLITNLYATRLQQADTMIDAIAANSFNFLQAEKYTLAEDTAYPANAVSMRNKLYKKIKLETLDKLADFENELLANDKIKRRQKTDSAQTAFLKKTISAYKRNISHVTQRPGGLQQFIADTYCEALASCYDPHTEFFPLTKEENFESALGNQRFRFGFSIKDDNNAGVIINELAPGSPAFKSGMLNKGDKFLTLQWKDQQAIDVADANTIELAQILAQSNHDKLLITVKKADGTVRSVTLVKEQAAAAENTKVKSFLLAGDKTFGYISLPSFYNDWEDDDGANNGCANDVAKEILKLKKENIAGLILDFRYNGGGSVQEAVELAGIFIDAGPVAQIKASGEEKIITLKDVKRGTVYDGPLIILVNGYSASAAELVAGSLQDYNRALILGSSTYGKATGQLVFPLDTTIRSREDTSNKKSNYYLKVTTLKLYRINGTTAQFTGVKPDIILPDFLQADPQREANEPFALLPTTIAANKYYKPYTALPLNNLQAVARQDADTIKFFKRLAAYIQQYRQENLPRDVSLNLQDIIAEKAKDSAVSFYNNEPVAAAGYTIQNNAYDIENLKVTASSNETNESFIHYLLRDPYLKISYDLLHVMSK